MRRTVRGVTGKTVFLDSRVLEKERTALVCVTTPALHVNCFMFDHRMAFRPVRIVATRAGDFPFNNGVMRGLIDLHPGLLMAADAGFVFELTICRNDRADCGIAFCNRESGSARRSSVHRVTIIAADIVSPVSSGLPECKVPIAGMTTHACLCLFPGRYRTLVKTHRMLVRCRITCMVWIVSVTCRASFPASDRRSRVTFRSMLRFQYACLVLVAAQTHLGIGLCERLLIRACEEKDENR